MGLFFVALVLVGAGCVFDTKKNAQKGNSQTAETAEQLEEFQIHPTATADKSINILFSDPVLGKEFKQRTWPYAWGNSLLPSANEVQWKEYVNEEYGISFKYPVNARVIDSLAVAKERGHEDQMPKDQILALSISLGIDNFVGGVVILDVSLEEYIKKIPGKPSSFKEIFVDGYPARNYIYERRGDDIEGYGILFTRHGLVYDITGSNETPYFEQFIRSFQFTD